MKFMKFVSTLVFLGLLASCAENVKDEESSDYPEEKVQTDLRDAQTGVLNDTNSSEGMSLNSDVVSYDRSAANDPNSVLATKIIYFKFDSDEINGESQELIAHHGKYLASNPDVSMRLEGHADERGTPEYNIALANRRAQSVRRLILFQGANADQIKVISYGEEKPVSLGHDEESWSMNRRVEIVYQGL